MRFILLIIALVTLNTPSVAYELDYYTKLAYLDNYGNLDLRNKPFTQLPSDLSIKGNLNISQTPITRLPNGLNVGGSLEAKNSALKTVRPGTSIKGYANLLGSQVEN